MGEANNVFNVFMSKPERIRSVLEYYLKEKLSEDWKCEDANGFYALHNSKGKVSHRQRDIIKRVTTAEGSYLLGIENQETRNLIFPWRLLQMFQDYKVNLVNMRYIPERELEQMDSDLRYILGLMRCA